MLGLERASRPDTDDDDAGEGTSEDGDGGLRNVDCFLPDLLRWVVAFSMTWSLSSRNMRSTRLR